MAGTTVAEVLAELAALEDPRARACGRPDWPIRIPSSRVRAGR